ncbi:glycine cleavage T C-terminal barrel domain-containing protein [Gemmatimonas sp.]|uniref:CAF17-like 4Fe-4S cluster assembly/insertion protein YgfZ n=1 Tax=Gemmatimonas sp. TaxID=1962908 RepID=UPI00334142C6
MSDSTISVAPEPPALVYPEPLLGDDVEAYLDLRRDAAWFEAMNHWSSVQGPKAMDALNGLVTNDVSQLAVGMGMHAVALTPKGKVVCDMYIARTAEDRFMLTVLRHCAPAWLDLARKYINPRLAKVADESDQWATWMVYGTNAAQAVANLGGAMHTVEDLGDIMVQGLAEWPVWSHGMWNIGPVSVRLVRAPVMGSLPGFIIIADARDTALVRERLEASTSRRATRAVWNIARIEGGRPAFGIDMDENTIPQEANLDTLGAISFTKGCYTGQETVARVHFRGHVNRHLRGLVGEAPLPQHARILDANGKDVGDVRSTAISPRLGNIAIAMIRREVEPGSRVIVRTGEGDIGATTLALPFAEN